MGRRLCYICTLGVPSVLNIERKGYWKFGIASPSPTLNLIEFHSQAMAVGYSNMNMTKESARILLDALAANGPGHVLSAARSARLLLHFVVQTPVLTVGVLTVRVQIVYGVVQRFCLSF